MAHGFVGTLIVVAGHSILGQLWIGAHHQDKGNVYLLDHLAQRRTQVTCGFREQDSIHPFRQQQLQLVLFFFFKNVVTVAEQEVVTASLRGILGAANDQGEKGLTMSVTIMLIVWVFCSVR